MATPADEPTSPRLQNVVDAANNGGDGPSSGHIVASDAENVGISERSSSTTNPQNGRTAAATDTEDLEPEQGPTRDQLRLHDEHSTDDDLTSRETRLNTNALPIRTSSMRRQTTSSESHDAPAEQPLRHPADTGTEEDPSNDPYMNVGDEMANIYDDFGEGNAGSFPEGRRGSSSQGAGRRPSRRYEDPPEDDQDEPEYMPPRWQPDAEVTYCPICRTQFSFFVRKHHCRKCGRVVCNSCSPHRIIIPHQYIVRAPGSDVAMTPSMLVDGLGSGYYDTNGMPGGERVRLCNPCVPDPNTAPPQSPSASITGSPRSSHNRSRSSLAGLLGPAPSATRYGGGIAAPGARDALYPSRSRSITMHPPPHGASGPRHRMSSTYSYQSPLERLILASSSGAVTGSSRSRRSSHGIGDVASSSRQRALPLPPQIAEEDECPVCHRELPDRSLPDFEILREAHITSCIQTHSTYGSPRQADRGQESQPAAPRRTGMYTYPATEKDCIDDAECTICLEEFTVGVAMARLECLCRFHRSCIAAWFVKHPGRCPVHQHDGFGF